MLRLTLIVTVLVLSLLSAAAHVSAPQDAEVRKVLPDAEGVRKSARKLDKAARDRIEKALGTKLEDKDIPTIWEGRATVHSASSTDKVRVLFCIVTAKGVKGDIRLAVAVAPDEEQLAAVKVLDNKDDKALEAPAFLQQFEGFAYAASLQSPLATLEDARSKGKAGADASAKQVGAFLALTELMHGVQAEFEAIQKKVDASEDGGVDPAKRLRAALADVEKVTGGFSGFLQKSQIDRFVQSTRASQKELDAVVSALNAKKWSEAGTVMHRIANEHCNRCHASLRSRFSDKRAELGIGNGYFVIGHELSAPADASKESAQAAATAVRRAVLVLTQSK